MKRLRGWLILSHRYLGLVIALLVVIWFASGIVMMYAGGMPRLTPQLRLQRLSNLDLSKVRLTPSDAAKLAGIPRPSGRGGRGGANRTVLLSVLNRPAYRFSQNTTVFADTGERLDDLSVEQAKSVASQFARTPLDRIRYLTTLEKVDQWTLGQGREMPLYKFAVDDGAGTELYVQEQTGEVVTLTTRHGRLMAWLGTIPHWLYFVALRSNQPAWYQIVVWTSALACVVALLGLVLGFTQFRRQKQFRLATAIPYSGWMRWHYITGVVFGIFTLTWCYSGLLSMEPFAWTRATGLEVPRDTLSGGPVNLSAFSSFDPAIWQTITGGRPIKEMEFTRIQDGNYYIVRPEPVQAELEQKHERLHQPYNINGLVERDRILVSADGLKIRSDPFSVESLISRLHAAFPNTPIVEQQLLTEYDSYYYSRGQIRPLPVLRVKFGDPARTWVYIDPAMSQVLAEVHRLNRLERWLYNGLHSLDFSFWYYKRPLWDIGMITLLAGGLISSAIGLAMGIKRLLRGRRKPSKSFSPPAGQPAIPVSNGDRAKAAIS